MIELKPCPFCGEAAQLFCGTDGVAVICTNQDCGCRTPWFEDRDKMFGTLPWINGRLAINEAMNCWNKRVGDDDEN